MTVIYNITPQGGAFAVCANGQPMRTPEKRPLLLPSRPLADAIAQEWVSGQKFSARVMPISSLAYTAIDRIAGQEAAIIEALLVYVDTETLCYRSEISPSPLVGEGGEGGDFPQTSALRVPPLPNPSAVAKAMADRPPHVSAEALAKAEGGRENKIALLQRQQWDPILAWSKERFGASWTVTEGIMPVEQPEALHRALRAWLKGMDAMRLSAACLLASGLSSLALAAAVLERHIDAGEAFRLSRLEEDTQAERWGRDPEAQVRAERMKEDIVMAARFLRLLEAS